MPRRTLLLAALLTLACGHEPTPASRSEAPLRSEAAPESQVPVTTSPAFEGPALESPALEGLSTTSRAALGAAPVPMLLLPADRAAASTVMSGEHWAALSYRDDALTISIHATDVSHPVVADDELLELPPPEASVRGEPARVTMNEQIQSVTWSEGSVSYVLEVECSRPFDDVRCTESRFVLELADQLVPARNVPRALPQPSEASR